MEKDGRLMSLDALRGFDMLWIMGGGSLACAISQAFGGGVEGALLFGGLVGMLPSVWQDVGNATSYLAVCWLFLYVLYRNKVFFKV